MALTLSIGIRGTAAMFSVTNAFLFRPFAAPDPEQIVVVAQRDEHTAGKAVALEDLESWLRPRRNSSSERLRRNVAPRAFREALGEFLGVSPD